MALSAQLAFADGDVKRGLACQLARLKPDRLQRVLLFTLGALWLLAAARGAKRDFADAWILDGILPAYAAFVALSAIAMLLERSNAVIAVLAAAFTSLMGAVPALKYVFPYGVTTDAAQHYILVQSLVDTGHAPATHTYAAIASNHAWLAQLRLLTGIDTDAVVALGPALCAGLLPLLAYWLCAESGMAAPLTRRVTLLSCLAAPPAYLLNGALFSLAPLVMTLGAAILTAFYSHTGKRKRAYALVAVAGTMQLVLWHSTTPLLLPGLLLTVAFAPVLTSIVQGHRPLRRIAWNVVALAALSAALFVGYHWLAADRVWRVIVAKLLQMLAAEQLDAPLVPQMFTEIPLLAKVNVAAVLHGRDIVLIALFAGGVPLATQQIRRRAPQAELLAALALVCAAFAALAVVPIPGASYQRFVWIPVMFAPFFGAAAVYWLETNTRRILVPAARMTRPLLAVAAAGLLAAWTIQIFPCQPLVPQVIVVGSGEGEYILWLHEVNTTPQERMLTFAETAAPADARFAADVWSSRQFMRLFGASKTARRGMAKPLQRGSSLDHTTARYFLTHWPGPAGGLGEQWANRSRAKMLALRELSGWNIVYDNGESFVLSAGPPVSTVEATRLRGAGKASP